MRMIERQKQLKKARLEKKAIQAKLEGEKMKEEVKLALFEEMQKDQQRVADKKKFNQKMKEENDKLKEYKRKMLKKEEEQQ